MYVGQYMYWTVPPYDKVFFVKVHGTPEGALETKSIELQPFFGSEFSSDSGIAIDA